MASESQRPSESTEALREQRTEGFETPFAVRGHPGPLEYHRMLLDDATRVAAYDAALRALVRPGDVVLDVGTGSGVLAILAARHGAARVHAVESMPVVHLARRLVHENGLAERIAVHHDDLVTMAPVEPVDLVVGDFMGRFLVDDDMMGAVHAAGRWLKPTGRFCPNLVALQLAPVGDFSLRALDCFREGVLGLSLDSALQTSYRTCYEVALETPALMARPADFAVFSPPDHLSSLDRELSWEMERPGELRGLAGWFEASLAPGVDLSTAPGTRTHWGQYLFPLPPIVVRPGDTLSVRVWLQENLVDWDWCWRGEVRRDAVLMQSFDLTSG